MGCAAKLIAGPSFAHSCKEWKTLLLRALWPEALRRLARCRRYLPLRALRAKDSLVISTTSVFCKEADPQEIDTTPSKRAATPARGSEIDLEANLEPPAEAALGVELLGSPAVGSFYNNGGPPGAGSKPRCTGNFLDRQGVMSYIRAIRAVSEAPLRKLFPTFAAVLFFVPAVLLAAEDGDLSLASILAHGADRRIDAETLAKGPGGVLAAVAGAESFPVGCATPLIAALERPESPLPPPLRQAYGALSGRPVLDAERVSVTRDGQFAIHYSDSARAFGVRPADRDRNGLPDIVDHLSESLAASRSFLVSRLGYPPPTPESQALDVYLVDLGHGLEGFAVAAGAPEGGTVSGAPPFLVLDANLPDDRLLAAALHQVAHASLDALARSAPWWSEASAAFLTLAATGDVRGFEPALRARLQSPGRGLGADDLAIMQGSLLWPLFLSERTGDAAIVRQIWGDIAARGADPLAAADRVLRGDAGVTLAQAFREYSAWNLFTGSRDDGRHYSMARSFPDAALTTIGPALPIDLDPVAPLEPMGSIAFRLPGNQGRGALDLDVRARGAAPAADLLVALRAETRGPVLLTVPLDASGAGRVSIPWPDVQEAWIILRNGAPLPGAAAFEVHGVLDPVAPYDLASFVAEGMGASMVLEWSTASEKGLVGWNVYRSESPSGPFTRLNALAIPAFGDGAADTGYIFIDDTARPGRRYYYEVEGFTDLGLPDRSPIVSGKIPPLR